VFRVRQPEPPTRHAECGYDCLRGYFVDVVDGDLTVSYDATSGGYDDEFPLAGALTFLSSYGFLGAADVSDARTACRDQVTGPLKGDLRRALRIIRAFEEAAGE
jgi:hypothetical protein